MHDQVLLYIDPEARALFALYSKDEQTKIYSCGNGLVLTHRGFYTRKETLLITVEEIEALQKEIKVNFDYDHDTNGVITAIRPLGEDNSIDKIIIKSPIDFNANALALLGRINDAIEHGVHKHITPYKATCVINNNDNANQPVNNAFLSVLDDILTEGNKVTLRITDTAFAKNITQAISTNKPIAKLLPDNKVNAIYGELENLLLKHKDTVLFKITNALDLGTSLIDLLVEKSQYLVDTNFVCVNDIKPDFLFKLKPIRSGLLGHPRLYHFGEETDNKDLLITASSEELGRAVPGISIGLVDLKETPPEITAMHDVIDKLSLAEEIFYVDLAHIFRSRIASSLLLFKQQGIIVKGLVRLVGDVPIITRLDPPMMTLAAKEKVDELKANYNLIKANDKQFEYIDVTDQLFQVDVKNMPLRKEIPTGTNNIRFKTAHGNIPIRLGNQLPDRNSLNRLKGNKTVTLIVRSCGHMLINFWVRVETEEGEGLWYNPFVNMIPTKKVKLNANI